MVELTKAEEQVMQYLWKLKKGFLKDIIEQFPEPRPANTTIATVLRKLVAKKAVSYTTYGKIHEYKPAFSREAYSKIQLKSLVSRYFNDSFKQFANFFSSQTDLSIQELEEIKGIIDKTISDQKEMQ